MKLTRLFVCHFMFEHKSRSCSVLSICVSNRKQGILTKRMSTWNHSYRRSYIPTFLLCSHHVIFLIKMNKDICVRMHKIINEKWFFNRRNIHSVFIMCYIPKIKKCLYWLNTFQSIETRFSSINLILQIRILQECFS
jgi:hypothetical protein